VIDLRGGRAVVSGASRGIGAATARLLARAGADVVVGYRSRAAEAEAVAAEARAAGVRAVTCGADLATRDGCEALVAAGADAFGGVDIVVVNHGVWPAEEVPVAAMDDARWTRTVREDLDSVFWLSRAAARDGALGRARGRAARAGVEHRRPSAARRSTPTTPPRRGAMISFVKSLAVELAPAGVDGELRRARVGGHRDDRQRHARRRPRAHRGVDPRRPRGHRGRRGRADRLPLLAPRAARDRRGAQRQRRQRAVRVSGAPADTAGQPAVAERRRSPRSVVALFTGGTISMRVDARAGGAVPSLTAEEILGAARGIERVASVWPEQWGRFPGPHITVARQWALRNRIAELVADPAVDGLVVTHGTDTLEETAYLVARSVDAAKPVVFTGAMRSASDLGWDGPQNLLDAVRVAAEPASVGHGVLVVMGSRIFAALEDAKTHTHQLDAFESPGLGPLGVVDEERVFYRRRLLNPPPVLAPPGPAEPVDIVTTWAGADSRLLDASRESGASAWWSRRWGGGTSRPTWCPASRGGWSRGGRSSSARAPRAGAWGRPTRIPGGGRKLHELGALFAGARRAAQARVDLMLALGAGLRPGRPPRPVRRMTAARARPGPAPR
jgi:L-asparaginase